MSVSSQSQLHPSVPLLLMCDCADTIAASSFQMQEVFSGYRQSGDVASKRRVREAINAALTSLPEWPQPLMF